MSRFKIGQRVVAVRNHSKGEFNKGDEFIIDGFACCPKCGIRCVYLFGKNDDCGSQCTNCNTHYITIRECYGESIFAPLQSFGEQIEESISKEAEEFATWAIDAIQTKP
jgi:hypothetical protein